MKQAIENILIERLQTSIEGISSILTNKFFDEFDSFSFIDIVAKVESQFSAQINLFDMPLTRDSAANSGINYL
ncbi:TPA: lipid A modification system glycine carrier protein AlmF, partial [Vibrio cholerae]